MPETIIELTESDKARFWNKVDRRGLNECWEWQGYLCVPGNYGRFQLNHTPVYAHRVAYVIACGSIPADHNVCHHCDNPPCCNPTHLFAGTQAENIADRDNKGHTPFLYGHNNGTSKLTEQDVREIRKRFAAGGVKQNELARQYGMSNSQINAIVHGRKWTWVKDSQS